MKLVIVKTGIVMMREIKKEARKPQTAPSVAPGIAGIDGYGLDFLPVPAAGVTIVYWG